MGLVGAMGVVFLAWRIPRLEPVMRKWFLHRPVVLGGRIREWQNSVTLFTSVVSLSSAHPMRYTWTECT
jgi:rhomboid-like protein